MTRERHTPGPWCVETPMDGCFSIVDDAEQVYNWRHIAMVTWDDKDDREPGAPFITKKQAAANAALIAAAPDLLRALKYCVIERSEWLEEARAAISRAESTALSGQT